MLSPKPKKEGEETDFFLYLNYKNNEVTSKRWKYKSHSGVISFYF